MLSAAHSDYPQMSILFDIWLISNVSAGLLDDDLMESGMSGDDFGMYSLLKAFGPAAPGQIGRWTGLRATTVSATLKRLAARGHTVQQRNDADGRSYLVALSAEGQGAHSRTAAVFWNQTRKLAQLLGPGEAARRQALQTLDADLRKAAGLDPRPYRLADETEQATWQVRYDGAPLDAKQEDQVRHYIDFLRASDK